ncbi:MAG: calcium-binding protein, partial [Rhizobiaceae bacterium]
ANILFGQGGTDFIDGREGADVLVGGAQADDFRFATALGVGNIDTVSDFTVAQDDLLLAQTIFTAIGATLDAGELVIGAAAIDANDFLIYNSATGALSYDANGSAAGGTIQFATLSTGLALTVGDFVMA